MQTEIIIQSKNFFHNQITLQLIHNTHFDIYTISILDNHFTPPQTLSPFGIFMTLQHATQKFNSIQL